MEEGRACTDRKSIRQHFYHNIISVTQSGFDHVINIASQEQSHVNLNLFFQENLNFEPEVKEILKTRLYNTGCTVLASLLYIEVGSYKSNLKAINLTKMDLSTTRPLVL